MPETRRILWAGIRVAVGCIGVAAVLQLAVAVVSGISSPESVQISVQTNLRQSVDEDSVEPAPAATWQQAGNLDVRMQDPDAEIVGLAIVHEAVFSAVLAGASALALLGLVSLQLRRASAGIRLLWFAAGVMVVGGGLACFARVACANLFLEHAAANEAALEGFSVDAFDASGSLIIGAGVVLALVTALLHSSFDERALSTSRQT